MQCPLPTVQKISTERIRERGEVCVESQKVVPIIKENSPSDCFKFGVNLGYKSLAPKMITENPKITVEPPAIEFQRPELKFEVPKIFYDTPRLNITEGTELFEDYKLLRREAELLVQDPDININPARVVAQKPRIGVMSLENKQVPQQYCESSKYSLDVTPDVVFDEGLAYENRLQGATVSKGRGGSARAQCS